MTEQGQEDMAYTLAWCGYWRICQYLDKTYEVYKWFFGSDLESNGFGIPSSAYLPNFLLNVVPTYATSSQKSVENLPLGLKHVRFFIPPSMEDLIRQEVSS